MQDYNVILYATIVVIYAILSISAVRVSIFSKKNHRKIERIVHSDGEVHLMKLQEEKQ